MRWSTACHNAPDETPLMRAMQSAADPDISALEQTGRNHSSFLPSFGARSAPLWPALIGCTECRGSAFLQRTAPAFGPLIAHWAENNAYPCLARSQNEMLRDHIRCEIHTAWDMEFRPRTCLHLSERAKNAVSRVLLLSKQRWALLVVM